MGVLDDRSWVEYANCTQVTPELFFPLTMKETQQIALAKEVCSECVVIQNCYDYAIKVNVQGIWAGTTLDQRNATRKRLKLVPLQMEETYKHLRQMERKQNDTTINSLDR